MRNIYIYCIAEKFDEVMVTGINNMPVRLLCYNGLCLVYSSIEKDIAYKEENFLAHEDVLEELISKDITILPFRFGTYLNEEVGETILKENYITFLENVKILKGKFEISIRALWDYDNVLAKVKENGTVSQINLVNPRIRDFFNKKMKDYKIEESIKRYAAEEAEKIHNNLSSGGLPGKYTLMKTNAMFFNAAYLVEKDKMQDFYSKFQQLTSNYSEINFLITGPWPPYNFCNLVI